MKVYLVQHVAKHSSDEEDVKIIGIYGSIEEAELVINQLMNTSGFSKFKKGFCIDEYELGRTFWLEGF